METCGVGPDAAFVGGAGVLVDTGAGVGAGNVFTVGGSVVAAGVVGCLVGETARVGEAAVGTGRRKFPPFPDRNVGGDKFGDRVGCPIVGPRTGAEVGGAFTFGDSVGCSIVGTADGGALFEVGVKGIL